MSPLPSGGRLEQSISPSVAEVASVSLELESVESVLSLVLESEVESLLSVELVVEGSVVDSLVSSLVVEVLVESDSVVLSDSALSELLLLVLESSPLVLESSLLELVSSPLELESPLVEASLESVSDVAPASV